MLNRNVASQAAYTVLKEAFPAVDGENAFTSEAQVCPECANSSVEDKTRQKEAKQVRIDESKEFKKLHRYLALAGFE